ncbi:hypothetical protein V2G26_009010 [Clonostachys chloroleuca]
MYPSSTAVLLGFIETALVGLASRSSCEYLYIDTELPRPLTTTSGHRPNQPGLYTVNFTVLIPEAPSDRMHDRDLLDSPLHCCPVHAPPCSSHRLFCSAIFVSHPAWPWRGAFVPAGPKGLPTRCTLDNGWLADGPLLPTSREAPTCFLVQSKHLHPIGHALALEDHLDEPSLARSGRRRRWLMVIWRTNHSG